MVTTRLRMALLGVLAMLLGRVFADDISVAASVDLPLAIEGDTINYTVRLDGATGAQFTAPTDVSDNLKFSGGPSQSQNFQFINGVQSSSMTYVIQFTAQRAGPYHIGPATVSLSGKDYTTAAIEGKVTTIPTEDIGAGVEVISARTGNSQIDRQLRGRLFLVMEAPKKVYVQEVVPVTVYVYRDPAFAGWRGQQYKVDSAAGGKDFIAVDNPDTEAKPMPAFHAADFGGKRFQKTVVARQFVVPTRGGKLSLDGPKLKVAIPLSNPRGDDFFMGFNRSLDAELSVKPVEIEAMPLPAPPAGTILQAVGNLTVSARLDRTELAEQELLALRVRLSGKGYLEQLSPPNIPDIPGFTLVNKTVSESKSDLALGEPSGSKEFEFVLQAMEPGEYTIPALAFAIFDPETEQQAVRSTEPMKVRVSQGAGSSQKVAGGDAGAASHASVQQRGRDINFIETGRVVRVAGESDGGGLLSQGWFWGANAIPLAAVLLFGGAIWRQRRLDSDPAARERGRLARRAAQALRDARRLAPSGSRDEFYAALSAGAMGFVASQLGRQPQGLTAEDGARALEARGASHELTRRLAALVERCDSIRYSPAADTPAQRMSDLELAEQLLTGLSGGKR